MVYSDVHRLCPWLHARAERSLSLYQTNGTHSTGTFQTRRIPVNVSLPYATTSVPSMQIFPDPDGTDPFSIGRTTSVPRFTMDVHTRAHHSAPSLVQIHVTHDPTRTRGVRVEVNGTLPLTTQQVEELEEFVRRGAVMGVAGKVWSWEMA